MAFSRTTTADSLTGTLSDGNWIADHESLIFLEAGAGISADDFPAADYPNGVRAGTLVHVADNMVKPGKGADGQVTGVTRYPWKPNPVHGLGSTNTMSVVVGGVIHVDKLPVMPALGDLPASFVLQNDSGKAFQ